MNDRGRNGDRSNYLLQWMVDNADGRSKSVLSAIDIHAAFAPIHTSAVAVTHINDLRAMTEYVEPYAKKLSNPWQKEVPPKRHS